MLFLEATGKAMSDVVNALVDPTTGLNATTYFGVLKDLVPYIVMLTPVALGVYFLRKLVKGGQKAKVRI